MSAIKILTPRPERTARPHRPKDASQTGGSWIVETGGGGGGGGGGGAGVPAPPVTINPPAEIVPRDSGKVEIDVPWTKAASANSDNFEGVAVYVEDPDISSGANPPLSDAAGSQGTGVPLDGSAQVSGAWQPIHFNNSSKSPAVVILDEQAGDRKVRIYLASYNASWDANLVRATDPSPTPNIVVDVPGKNLGNSGQEYSFLVTNAAVQVNTDYNRPDPNYFLVFTYTPPDPTIPIPSNQKAFGACRIIYVPVDANNENPQFNNVTDSGLDVPIKWDAGFKSPVYTPSPAGTQFRCYFCSEDIDGEINSLVEGVTPYALAVVAPLPSAPDVSNFTISNQQITWLLDGSYIAQATFAWDLPTSADGAIRYAGVYLYLVNVTGSNPPLTKFPQALTGAQSNVDTGFSLSIPNGLGAVIPANPEVWTVAAISFDSNGVLADDPKNIAHSPTVTWNIGPPQPGSPGSGLEYAPWVTVDPSAMPAPTESTSSDGVRMVSFNVGPWTNPTDPKFGGVQVAMIVNRDPSHVTFWSVPLGATSFQTPTFPAPGNFGQQIPVNFYLVSDDPQGHKNELIQGTTPRVPPYSVSGGYLYTPTEGAVIPARSGWFDQTQFQWQDPNGGLTATSISSQIVQVGSHIVVGGGPTSFGGMQNGQIAVYNSTPALIGWIGQQNAGSQSSPGYFGAWFKQLWVGGSDPTTAPIYVDNQGIIEVGGIAAQNGYAYPYISIRDQSGIEAGRIGASLNAVTGLPGDNTGGSPPAITAGAWFTQLAAGGNNISNWCIEIIPDASNPAGSQFQMRNLHLLSIDYAAQSGTPANNEYRLDFGNSVWMAGGLAAGQWQFPGIHIYEVEGGNNFGATFLNRGMVLRGTNTQGYPVLVSLVTFNGNSSGSDSPAYFYGELSMFSSYSPYQQTVALASGTSSSGTPSFGMWDNQSPQDVLFFVDGSGNVSLRGTLTVTGYGVVIDAAGNWKGVPISAGASQSPWTGNIEGAGFNLNNAGRVAASSFSLASNPTNPVINTSGAFVGAGVNVGSNGVGCGSVSCSYSASRAGEVACGMISVGGWNATGTGDINCSTIHIGGVACAANGIWGGNGVQTALANAVYGGVFGISTKFIGWPQNGSTSPATGNPQPGYANGATGNIVISNGSGGIYTVVICGGLIIAVN